METVNRYMLVDDSIEPRLEKNEEGSWVKWEDYERLEAMVMKSLDLGNELVKEHIALKAHHEGG